MPVVSLKGGSKDRRNPVALLLRLGSMATGAGSTSVGVGAELLKSNCGLRGRRKSRAMLL